MRIWTGLAAAGAAALTLTACSEGSDPAETVVSSPAKDTEGTLTVWLMDGSQPASVIDSVNERFAKKYPDVEVNIELQQWGDIQDKLASTLGTESTPDVVEIGNNLTAVYAAADQLADLSPYAEDFDVAGMLPGLKPPGELDGVRYGIPYYGGVNVVVYNRSHFDDAGVKVPTSLQQLKKAAAALQEDNKKNKKYSAFYFPGKYWKGAVPFIWDAGGEIAENDGQTWTGTLDQPKAVEGLTTLQGLVEDYSQAPVDADETKNLEAFQTGDVGMMIDSWWAPGALNRGDLKGDVGAFALPGSKAGTTSPVFIGGSDLSVSARSSQPGLAVEWMKIITNENTQTMLAEELGIIPNQEGAFVGHRGNPFLLIADEAATNSRFTPVSPYWPNVESAEVLPTMLTSIFSGGLTVAEAAEQASAEITGLLNE